MIISFFFSDFFGFLISSITGAAAGCGSSLISSTLGIILKLEDSDELVFSFAEKGIKAAPSLNGVSSVLVDNVWNNDDGPPAGVGVGVGAVGAIGTSSTFSSSFSSFSSFFLGFFSFLVFFFASCSCLYFSFASCTFRLASSFALF